MKGSGVCDFTQDDALIFKFLTGWRIWHAPAWQMLKNMEGPWQTCRRRDGQMRGLKTGGWTDRQKTTESYLCLWCCTFGKLTDNTSLRQFTSLSAHAMSVFTMCVGTTLPPYFTPDGIFMPSVSHFLCRHTCTHSHTCKIYQTLVFIYLITISTAIARCRRMH